MKNQFKMLFAFIALMVMVSLACGGVSAPTADPAVQARQTDLASTASAPKPNTPTATDASSAPAAVGDLYTHSTGAFSFTPPAGWTKDERDAAVTFTSADGVGLISVFFTNVGYKIDSAGFENFVTGNELNRFSFQLNYTEISREGDAAGGQLAAFKKFDLDGGKPQVVSSTYIQSDNIILAADYWVDADAAEAYSGLFDTVTNSLKLEASKVSDFDLYHYIYNFTSDSDLFTMDVPTPWIYTYAKDGDVTIEKFSAPDNNAFIESIIYNDGSSQNGATAGAGALALLNNYYTNGGGDIKVTEDKIMEDGSERLTWTSKKGGYSGLTFFEVPDGKTILILSTVTSNDYVDVYSPVFDYTLSTYKNK